MSIYSSGIADLFAVGVIGFFIGYGFPRANWLKNIQVKILNLLKNYFDR